MKKSFFLLLFIFVSSNVLRSQTDSIQRKYLVYSLKGTNFHNFFKENKFIVIKDKNNHRFAGNLNIINDSMITILDPYATSIKYDTFHLKDLKHIRPSRFAHQIGSVFLSSVSVLILALGKFTYNIGDYTSAISLISAGLFLEVESINLVNGTKISSKHYKIKIVTIVGHKLKRKDLKKLMIDF